MVDKRTRPHIALLIPAHNEELVLADTINSAIQAGLNPQHIYVVDDNSTDKTTKIARELLPRQNVCKVRRSGKGLAIKKAARKFNLAERYRWIHVADADGRFADDYFKKIRANLRVKNAAATGYIRSLKAKYVSQYRVFEYTVGMEVHRRIQSMFNVIPIIPGPTSCFRADVFAQLDFHSGSLTEDFDVTMQIYRKKLGSIQFIRSAVAYTQDPLTLKNFVNQITRWNRGVLQVMSQHKVYRSIKLVDMYLKYQLFQNMLFFVFFLVWVPYLAITTGQGTDALAVAFLYDVAVTFLFTLFSAARVKRWDIISAFPFVYGLRWVNLGVFLKSFIEVVILRRYRSSMGTWQNDASRRYKVAT